MSSPRRLPQAQDLAARLPPLLVAAERVAASLVGGSHGRRRAGSGDNFWQYRPAAPGDPAHAIDWRRSGRGPGLFVRETEWSAAQGVWLWADIGPTMDWCSRPDLERKAARAQLLVLALAALLLRGGERVALLGGDEGLSSGPGTLARLAREMELAEISGGTAGLPQPHRLPRHGELVLISDFLRPPERLAQDIAALAGQGATGHLLQVLDPAEESLPYAGRVRFLGVDSAEEVMLRRAEDCRGQYRDVFNRHRDAVAAIAASHGWSFAVHHTDRAPQQALLALHARLSLPRRRFGP